MKNQVESLSSPTQSTLLLLWDRPMVLQGSPLTSRSSRKLPFPFPPVTFLHPPPPHPTPQPCTRTIWPDAKIFGNNCFQTSSQLYNCIQICLITKRIHSNAQK